VIGLRSSPSNPALLAESEGPLCGPIATQGRSCKGPRQPAESSRQSGSLFSLDLYIELPLQVPKNGPSLS